ncbi:uncharacterized protein LOC143174427 [Nomia melanderi]|uniref:uncharacterized protein LOC143174427 n=1 Tax=Nomia melanderi TaxID=2448451 RepID=UPI003FCD2EA9
MAFLIPTLVAMGTLGTYGYAVSKDNLQFTITSDILSRIMVTKENATLRDNEEPSSSKSITKSPGKVARQKYQDKFRAKVDARQMKERHDQIDKRWGLSSAEIEEVTRSLDSIQITSKNRGRPIPISTRGVGFSCVAEYNKMCTTWNFNVISKICSVH